MFISKLQTIAYPNTLLKINQPITFKLKDFLQSDWLHIFFLYLLEINICIIDNIYIYIFINIKHKTDNSQRH